MFKSNFKKKIIIGLSILTTSMLMSACGDGSENNVNNGEVVAQELSEINPVMDLEIVSEQSIDFKSQTSVGYVMVDNNSGCNYFVHKKLKGAVTMSPIYDETGSVKGCGENI